MTPPYFKKLFPYSLNLAIFLWSKHIIVLVCSIAVFVHWAKSGQGGENVLV